MNQRIVRTRLQNEHGQSIVLIALAMVTILAGVGLVMDGGQVYFTRRNGQNTADATAYAGARVFAMRTDNSASSTQTIWNAITTYGAANYVPNASNLTAWFVDTSNKNIYQINQSPFPTIPSNATGVRVLATQQFTPTFIAIIRGNSPMPVQAQATVQVGPVQAPKQLMPMAIVTQTHTITYGVLITLEGGGTASGNFQWADFGLSQCGSYGGGKNVLVGLLSIPQACSPPPVVANETWANSKSWINSQPGLAPNNNITNALDAWLALAQDERGWLVPLTECTGDPSLGFPAGCGQKVGGNQVYYYTWGFGEFQLIGYCWNKKCNGDSSVPPLTSCPDYNVNKDMICGMFVKMTDSGSPGGPGPCNINGEGICAMELTE